MTKSDLANENLPRVPEAKASNIHSLLNSKAYAFPSLSKKKFLMQYRITVYKDLLKC